MAEPGPEPTPGPLRPGDLAPIEASLLPALERHHLRLLVHGLRTLQTIASEQRVPMAAAPGPATPEPAPPMPGAAVISAWAGRQPPLAGDDAFAASFQQQLLVLAGQLEAIARELGRYPLELEVEDLIGWARQQADARLTGAEPSSGSSLP